MAGIQMSGMQRLLFDMGFGTPERTEVLITVLGASYMNARAEEIIKTFSNEEDILMLRHRYGIGCPAKIIPDLVPFVMSRKKNENAVVKIIRLLKKKLRAPSRIKIMMDCIKDVQY